MEENAVAVKLAVKTQRVNQMCKNIFNEFIYKN